MGLLNKIFGKEEALTQADDQAIVSVCDGEMIPAEKIEDPVFSQQMMGKTIGFLPEKGSIVSPVNGTVEAIFPTGHAFGIRGVDKTGYLVHIGINTVAMKGAGFTVLKKTGDEVRAGEAVVKVDLAKVKLSGYQTATMLIVTEPTEGRSYDYITPDHVKSGQVISR